jgi:hypothetical protein
MTRTFIVDHVDGITVEDARLGRLVLRPREPHQDYCDPSGTPLILPKVEVESFKCFSQSLKSTSIQSKLTKFLSAAFNNKKNGSKDISATKVEINKLGNSGVWFKEACKDSRVREWIQESLDQGSNIYLIVGYCILIDSQSDFILGGNMSGSAGAHFPVPLATGNNLDVSMVASYERQCEEKSSAHFPGQTVCAAQYRKLLFKWLSSKSLENGALEKGNRWKLAGAFRGEDEDDEEDVLDVDLAGEDGENEDNYSDGSDEE